MARRERLLLAALSSDLRGPKVPSRLETLHLMALAKQHASTILRQYHRAEVELIGKAVVLSDGKAGTIEAVLDELHGLRLSIAGHIGRWPVFAIKLLQA